MDCYHGLHITLLISLVTLSTGHNSKFVLDGYEGTTTQLKILSLRKQESDRENQRARQAESLHSIFF